MTGPPNDTAPALVTRGRQVDQNFDLRPDSTIECTHSETVLVGLAEKINCESELAQQAAETAVQHAVRCGELLLTVKASLKHGDFMPWIEKNCKFQQSTATRYINAARQIATGVAISSIRGLFPSGDAHNHRTQGKIRKTDTPVREIEDHDHVVDDVEAEPKRTKRQSRGQRWNDAAGLAIAALDDLIAIQSEYQEWRDSLPDNLGGSTVAEKLDAVIDIDLQSALDSVNEAQGADLPLGFGRD